MRSLIVSLVLANAALMSAADVASRNRRLPTPGVRAAPTGPATSTATSRARSNARRRFPVSAPTASQAHTTGGRPGIVPRRRIPAVPVIADRRLQATHCTRAQKQRRLCSMFRTWWAMVLIMSAHLLASPILVCRALALSQP